MGRRIIIILLIILIPLIIGAAVFLGYRLGWFKSNPEPPKEYIYSAGEYTVNLDEPGYKRYMKVSVSVASEYKKLDAEIAEKMPRVRDAIISILRAKKIEDVNTSAKTETVKKEIKDKLNGIFTTGKITNVYLNDIIIQ